MGPPNDEMRLSLPGRGFRIGRLLLEQLNRYYLVGCIVNPECESWHIGRRQLGILDTESFVNSS